MSDSCELECDYLVIGAGPRCLAFVEALLARAREAAKTYSVIIADGRDQPGGSWADTYNFAQWDYPSAFHGLTPSRPPPPRKTRGGPSCRNSPSEVLMHYSSAMEKLVRTGCVRYIPMCSVSMDGTRLVPFFDPTGGHKVTVRRKIVDTSSIDAGQMQPVPGHPFEVQGGALVVRPKRLTSISTPHPKYVVIGSGRTGMDVVLWLLTRGLRPDRIIWVMTRDAWMLRRESIEPAQIADTIAAFSEKAVSSGTCDSLYEALEEAGLVCRIDPTRRPEVFRGAAVSLEELTSLRRITNVVRLGYVRAVTADELLLEGGTVATGPGALHIDCTGSTQSAGPGLAPVFSDRRIVLQQVAELPWVPGAFGAIFSAALVGHLEALYPEKQDKKNAMCTPIAAPVAPVDWLKMYLQAWKNSRIWKDERSFSWMCSGLPSCFTRVTTSALRGLVDSSRNALLGTARDNVEKMIQEHDAMVSRAKEAVGVGLEQDTHAMAYEFEHLKQHKSMLRDDSTATMSSSPRTPVSTSDSFASKDWEA